jgi:uncharacterized integral membrane protein (TIGR00698 family)
VASGIALTGVGLALLEELVLGQAWLESLVLALLIGVLARNLLAPSARFLPGSDFAAKQVLEVAVALLGLTISLPVLLAAGPKLLILIVLGVAASLLVSFTIGRLLGLTPHLAVLVAAGNSICGNSAIAAVAPAIRAGKKDVVSAISLTAILGVLVVLLLPVCAGLLGLSHYQYGIVAGMSVYAVPQVLAATLPVSELSGQVGTLVKLVRVALLGPVVLILGILFRRGATQPVLADNQAGRGAPAWYTYLPWFVAVFIGFAALRSLGLVPDVVAGTARQASSGLTILAMAGLGLGVDLAAVRRVGPRVACAVLLSLVFLLSSVTIAVHAFDL